MSETGDYFRRLNELVGPEQRIHLDELHAGKPRHMGLATRFEGGADIVEVDGLGNILPESRTQVGPQQSTWGPMPGSGPWG